MKNALFLIIALVFCACDNASPVAGDPDGGTDSDSDTDTDTDSDTDVDTTDDCVDEDNFVCEVWDCSEPCVRFVNGSIASSGDGLSWAEAFGTVQEAIDSAHCAKLRCEISGHCEVWTAAGTYNIYKESRCDTVRLRPEVDVYGGFDGTEAALTERDSLANVTTLDGHDAEDPIWRTFHVVTGADEAIIDGFTITGGSATNGLDDAYYLRGGGMYNNNASPHISNCVFVDNEAAIRGGALYNTSSSSTVSNCEFTDNTVKTPNGEHGGGAIGNINSSIAITECTFEDNYSIENGGAIYSYSSSDTTVNKCTFINNSSAALGGAVYSNGNSLSMSDCFFQGNSAVSGGGVFYRTGTGSITNNLFTGNTADERGGGIGVTNDVELDIVNCTFWGNNGENGSAIGSTGSTVLNIANSIVWSDSTGALDGPADVYYSAVYDYVEGIGNITLSPMLVDPENGDFHIQAGSPCIDAADGDAAPATDIEGNPRVDDPATADTGVGSITYADIGAYEYQP